MPTGGNVNDCTRFVQVMAGVEFRRPGPGRPVTGPARVPADKDCSTRAVRAHLRERGIPATIPERRGRQANRLRKGRKWRTAGQPPSAPPGSTRSDNQA
ncbi:hypothetical protein GCM10009660_16420 [Catellatospora bangladeshensis]